MNMDTGQRYIIREPVHYISVVCHGLSDSKISQCLESEAD